MAKMWKRYTDEIYKDLGYLAGWPPSGRVEVGDIALFEDRTLERQASLGDLGVETETLAGAEVRDHGFASTKTISVTPAVGAGGPVHPGVVAEAELEVAFKAKYSILMRAERSREHSLDRLDMVRRELLRLHDEGTWKKEWILITHVIKAQRLVAMISNGKEATARLRLTAGIAEDPSALATARGTLDVLAADRMAFLERGVLDATPLYRAVRVQRRHLRENRVKRIGKRGRARAGPADFEVAEVTF